MSKNINVNPARYKVRARAPDKDSPQPEPASRGVAPPRMVQVSEAAKELVAIVMTFAIACLPLAGLRAQFA